MADDLVLAAEFPAATLDQWRAQVAKIVAKSHEDVPADAPERVLRSRTVDGIPIEPLYVADPGVELGLPGQAPFTRGRTAVGNRAGWDVRVRVADPDAKDANDQLLEDLAGGASSVWLRVGAGGTSPAELDAVLADVLLDVIAVDLEAGTNARAVAESYLDLAARRNVDPNAMSGTIGLDPLGLMARTGKDAHVDEALEDMALLSTRLCRGYANVRTASVDALPYHDAGASDAQEIAASLATGLAYVRAMDKMGLHVNGAFEEIDFRYAVTVDQFASIAKLRAARRCWARVAQASGVTTVAGGQRQHAVTSWPMMTRSDPWTNMLRTTVAAFGACVGGADSITVLPFDAAIGRSDALARRIARNTGALLVEESHIAEVVDPAGGSGYVEALTEQLAKVAWSIFQEIEAGGGMRAVLADGSLAEGIATVREARYAAIEAGTETILGVNAFPLQDEKPLERPLASPIPGGGLPRIRWSEKLEATGA